MSAVEGNDDEETASMTNKRDADSDGLAAGSTGSVGMPANCVAKEQKRKNRGLKVRQPQYGFFSRRKFARDRLNRSVRNAQDCREHCKLHYQCLEEMVLSREQAIQSLRRELETYKKLCLELDEGRIPKPLHLLVSDGDAE